MKGKSFIGEWKYIFTNKSLLIPIIAVMLIPVLYAGMFLWAFWDPYDKLEDLPVAVVNSDTGASFEGEDLQLGNELVKSLKENATFNFIFVDKEEGYEELEKQEYYMLVEIPSDFSENATTILDDDPKKLELIYVPNEGYNFLSAQIGETAIEKVKAAVSEEIIFTYSETIFEKIEKMADGFQEASDSATTLYDGLVEINDGTTTLKESLETLASKQIEFKNGVDTVNDGVGQLSSGSQELATGLGLLSEAQGQLESGALQVQTGLSSAATGGSQLSEGMNSAYTNMGKLTSAIEQLHDGSGTLNGGLSELNSGASTLSTGASSVASGAKSVATGIEELSAGATSLSTGASSLNQGIVGLQASLQPYMAALPADVQQQLTAVLSQLANGSAELVTGSQSLATGSEALVTGSKAVASGSQEVAAGASKLSTGASKLSSGSQSLTAGLDELSQGATALESGMGQLNSASGELASGLGELQAGQNQVVSGMQQFGSKLGDASTGAQTLNEGLLTLSGGVTQLADGSSQLSDGAGKLADGANTLSEGTTTAEEGSLEFKDALSDAADESSEVNATDDTFDMMSQPVEVEKDAVDAVPNYGTGFAPYFLSLGLFVGALMLSIIYPLVEPAIQPRSAFSWFFSKFGVLATVGVLQALLAVVILLFGLKIEVQSLPLFILFSIVTSLVFITLIQFFVTCFANPGRFIAIILLILQLTTSAGTFPLELIPGKLQFFNSFLPMTYTVRGYKAVISSGNFDVMWQNVMILGGFIVLFMIGTLSYFGLKFKKSFSRMAAQEVE